MKSILKKFWLISLLAFIVFSTTILTACNEDKNNEDKNAQAFYDYAVTAKATLDNLAEETDDFLYTITYNPSGINLNIFANISSALLKEKRDAVQSDYYTLSELYENTKDSSLYFEVKDIFYAFEDYANFVFNMERPYSTFISKKVLYERELRDALFELERALSN